MAATSHPAPPRPLAPLARRIAAAHQAGGPGRSPQAVARALSAIPRYTALFSPDVRGVECLPATGPVLVVGNHSCTFWMPDAAVVGQALVERRGVAQPTYALAYDLLFAIPVVGRLLREIGVVPADESAALAALHAGAAVLVFPGGDHDACRPWSERDRIAFGDHRGFVRLALRAGVPVVPAVSHGAHHGTVILARGEPAARLLRLAGLRVNVLPLTVGPPLGVVPLLGPPPLPARITVEFLPPLTWPSLTAAAADDPEVVDSCFRDIRDCMQSALDRLAAEQPHPVRSGVTALARRGGRVLGLPT